MFDIALSEVMIIAVVALIVIGPERLPRVARTVGHLFGRMQRYVNDVKADIQREVELDELRKLKQSVEDSARSIETSVTQELNSVNQAFDSARDQVRDLEALVQGQPQAPAGEPRPSAAVPDQRAVGGADAAPAAAAGPESASGSKAG